jgi:hypothetical protein
VNHRVEEINDQKDQHYCECIKGHRRLLCRRRGVSLCLIRMRCALGFVLAFSQRTDETFDEMHQRGTDDVKRYQQHQHRKVEQHCCMGLQTEDSGYAAFH